MIAVSFDSNSATPALLRRRLGGTVQTLALLLLALTLAHPVSSETTALDDTIQVIAQQQKMISQTYKLERAGAWVMHSKTLALLAAYGSWTTFDPAAESYAGTNQQGQAQPIENFVLLEVVQRLRPEMVYAKSAAERNQSVSEDELKRFSDIYLEVETLFAVADDVSVLVKAGKIDEANALYRDKSVPLISTIKADSYTLISSLEEKIDKAALHARLVK